MAFEIYHGIQTCRLSVYLKGVFRGEMNSFKAVKLKLIIFGVKASVIDFKKTPIIL